MYVHTIIFSQSDSVLITKFIT